MKRRELERHLRKHGHQSGGDDVHAGRCLAAHQVDVHRYRGWLLTAVPAGLVGAGAAGGKVG